MLPKRNRSLSFSESQVKKRRLMMKITYAGIVKRLVSKVLKPADFRFNVIYYGIISKAALHWVNAMNLQK